MLKKRLIFTLLYSYGKFILSRNFRHQKVGDFSWLKLNYNFSHISYSIDELIVLDVTRGEKNIDDFCATLKLLTEGCFVPIAAGGGINSIASARKLLRSGADKVVVNSSLYGPTGFVSALASEFGQQCIVASMDFKSGPDGVYQVWSEGGTRQVNGTAANWVDQVLRDEVGEIYINSMDRDGPGQGYDLGLLDLLPTSTSKSVILAGGVGNATHLANGLVDPRVDAVATAHLFNFVGNGLKQARSSLILSGFDLPVWDLKLLESHLNAKHFNEV